MVTIIESVSAQTDELITDSGDYRKGQLLFETNCSACHSIHQEILGPVLASITKKKPQSWIVSFIRNSQNVIASGDPYANVLFRKYDNQVMPSFEKLPYDQIKAILFYIEHESKRSSGEFSSIDVQQDEHIDPGILRGKVIFRQQCQSCHFIEREGFGPALGSVTKRLSNEWLRNFVKNSQAVVQSGDPYAVYLYQSFDRREMVPMSFLADEEIDDVLNYIEYASMKENHPMSNRLYQQSLVNIKPEDPQGSKITKYVLIGLSIVAGSLYIYLISRLFRYLQGTR
ncbi:MAG TPA: cytochrome c [Cyclobacteriaceae bacterium]|nr:cytochrome c [Cyclobacteriaceae bacterium]